MPVEDRFELMKAHKQNIMKVSDKVATSKDSLNTSSEQIWRNGDDKELGWIRRKAIQCRKCTRFVPTKVPKGGSEKTICGCGYDKLDHDLSCPTPSAQSSSTAQWNHRSDTEPYLTDSFGEIEFVGFGQRYAKYIRVDVDTEADVIWQLMTRVWGLRPPNLVISVTGGAKNFHMTPRLKNVFRKGLIKAATSTEAWITSSGTHAGVMKYVGEAVRDQVMVQASQSGVVAVGIAPWGCVQNKEALQQAGGSIRYRISGDQVPGETPLDFNHSHFILVDNGTQHKFAVEIPFRAKLEKTISMRSSSSAGDNVKVPIILIVVEGGPGTLQTLYNSIKKRTPAVIIAGSGRAANILGYAIQNSYEHVYEESRQGGEKYQSKALVMSTGVEAEVTKMLREVFEEKSEKKLVEWASWIKHCLLFPDLLSVYQLDSDISPKDIDLIMLQALLKANHEQALEQLKLALIWNRVDIAKSDIIADDRRFETGTLDDIMFSAILLNRVDFVKLFLENGISLRDFLTISRLERLYESVPRKSLLYELLKKTRRNKHKERSILDQVGHLIRSLMGDFYDPVYLRSAFKISEGLYSVTVDTDNRFLERPERDLFVWCVLLDRCVMAQVFWEEGKDSLAAALAANSLLKAMRQRTTDNDLKQELQRDALEFQELSIGILRECYADDEGRAMQLLIRPLHYWGRTNCVSIAIEADNKEFIAQSACQELFNAVWWGEMDTRNGLRILPCVMCPVLALACLRFKQSTSTTSNTQADCDIKSSVKRKSSLFASTGRQPSVTSQCEYDRTVSVIDRAPSEKIKYFFQAPVTKFCYTVAFFLVFLMLYSYVMLIDFHSNVSVPEIVLIVWVATMAIEEGRQLWKSSPGPVWIRILCYLSDKWNILDLLTIGLFTVGMILRAVPHHGAFVAARTILSINLFTFFIRLLHIFSVSKIMGPKLVMIGRMLKDLLTFMLIMLVFIVGYGITSQSILYPNTDLNKMLVVDVLKKAYWQMFAELFLEEIEGKEDCVEDMMAYTNSTHVRCPSEVGKVLVPILLGFYLLIMHVLLLSLLIAVFTNTFEAIHANTDLHWHFQRYKLVYEYYERPTLPPPFIIMSHVYRIIQFCMAGCETNVMYGFLSQDRCHESIDTKSMELFEENQRDEFMWERKQRKMKTTDYRVASTSNSVDGLVLKVDELREHLSTIGVRGSSITKIAAPKPTIDAVNNLQKQVSHLQHSLKWIIKSLQERGTLSEGFSPSTALPTIRIDSPTNESNVTEEIPASPVYLTRPSFYRQTTSVETRELDTLKSRASPYPGTSINRTEVPDDKASWDDSFPLYNPVSYTSKRIEESPLYADVNIDQCPFVWNAFDNENGVNRVSFQGDYSIDQNGYPLNPIGRTGLRDRGRLGRWGPNHAADPIVTRWKKDKHGTVVERDGKPVLEFVAVRRHDNKHWALPGGFIRAGESVDDAVRRRFCEEAMASDRAESKTNGAKLLELLSRGTEIYRGYVDDERNTDNAWIETVAMNYHDNDGTGTEGLVLNAGKTEDAVAWLPVWSKIPMQANHCFILERVSELMDAAL